MWNFLLHCQRGISQKRISMSASTDIKWCLMAAQLTLTASSAVCADAYTKFWCQHLDCVRIKEELSDPSPSPEFTKGHQQFWFTKGWIWNPRERNPLAKGGITLSCFCVLANLAEWTLQCTLETGHEQKSKDKFKSSGRKKKDNEEDTWSGKMNKKDSELIV